MDVLALAAKSLLAAMLLVAGGAKLADLASFASAARLFVPVWVPRTTVRWVAGSVAVSEFALGAGSLSWPAVGWLNPVVFTLACGFVTVSGAGYIFHRGQSCRCFGGLSRRKFDAMGIIRSTVIAVAAAISLIRVRHVLIAIDGTEHLLLLLAAIVVSLAAFTAARSLAAGRRVGLETR